MPPREALLLVAVVVASLGFVGTAVASPSTQNAAEPFAVVPEGSSVEASVDDNASVGRTVAADLDVRRSAVRVTSGAVEVTADGVPPASFAAALRAAGIEASESDVRTRLSATTVAEIEAVVSRRYEESGVEASVTAEDGYLLVDPSSNGSRARRVATTTGVGMRATVPAENDTRTERILDAEGVAAVGEPRTSPSGQPYLPVTLTETGAEEFSSALVEYGFTREGGTRCEYDLESPPEDPGRCLLTVVDGEVVFAAGLAPGLADSIESGDFERNPRFRIVTSTLTEARDLGTYLRSGALPAPVEIRSAAAVRTTDEGTPTDAAAAADGAGPPVVFALLAVLLAGVVRRRNQSP